MQPIAAQQSSDSYKGLGLVVARCDVPNGGSSGSQSPNAVLAGIELTFHEHWTSRRPWAFVVGAIKVAAASPNLQWRTRPLRERPLAG